LIALRDQLLQLRVLLLELPQPLDFHRFELPEPLPPQVNPLGRYALPWARLASRAREARWRRFVRPLTRR
jgi:hypothetical protein